MHYEYIFVNTIQDETYLPSSRYLEEQSVPWDLNFIVESKEIMDLPCHHMLSLPSPFLIMHIKESASLSCFVLLLLLRKVDIDLENTEILNYVVDDIFQRLDRYHLLLYHLLMFISFNTFLIQVWVCRILLFLIHLGL